MNTENISALQAETGLRVRYASRPAESVKEGERVIYVLEAGRSKGESRPAFVVRKFLDTDLVNIQVLTDGLNDGYKSTHLIQIDGKETVLILDQNSIWRTSIHYSAEFEPGTWHWPDDIRPTAPKEA